MQIKEAGSASALKVAGSLDFDTLDELRMALGNALASQSGVTVDTSEVEACDVASLQLFYAAQHSAARRNQLFALKAPSEAIGKLCEALGLPLEALVAAGEGPGGL